MDALIDRGYENVVVVDGGYDGWVKEYTPGGKKRLQEWKLDVVVGASGTSCVGAELPVVGGLAEERKAAQIAHLKALEEHLVNSNANSAWKVAFDRFDRLYFYNVESEKSQWADPSAYDVTNQIWLLSAPMSDSGAIALTAISVDDAVQRLLSKSSMVIDVRNPYAFNMESVNGVINVP